jgi:glutamyl-tRNA reductase
MEIILIGINHKTAPVEVREKCALSRDEMKSFLEEFTSFPGVQEGLVLSTCNRMEILFVSDCEAENLNKVKVLLSKFGGITLDQLTPHLYVYQGLNAVRHLFQVASSLDSMIIGEPQILGQVKEAYRQAVANKKTKLVLNKLLHRSFSIAKRVRTETKIAHQAVSVSFAAVELAQKILGDLEEKRILLVGAGDMCELAARHFLCQGVQEIWVTNRTLARAEELAREFQGKAIPFAEFPQVLREVDIVLSSTGSSHYIIGKHQVSEAMRSRKNRPMFFIDIAVPRDVEPAIHEMDNVYLYNIDDLEGVVESNREERKKEVEKAEAIIAQGVMDFNRWLKSLEVIPTIQALRQRMENICKQELEKTFPRLQGISEAQRQNLELMTQAIISKILHRPITLLKRGDREGHGKFYLEMTRKIFDLDEDNGNSDEEES